MEILGYLVSYTVGAYNYAFLTCDEFEIAGDIASKNCWEDS